MEIRALSPEGMRRAEELAKSSYRPPEIMKLKEEIEGGKKGCHASRLYNREDR